MVHKEMHWYNIIFLMTQGKEKCSEYPGHLHADNVSIKYLYEIAKLKQEIDPYLKFHSVESVCKMVAGQCNSMGIGIVADTEKPKPIKITIKM